MNIAYAERGVLQGGFRCASFRPGKLQIILDVLDGTAHDTDTLPTVAASSGNVSYNAPLHV